MSKSPTLTEIHPEIRTEARVTTGGMLDQQLALSAYLEALLQPAPAEVVTQTELMPARAEEPVIPPAAVEQPVAIEELAVTVSEFVEMEAPVPSAPVPQPGTAYPEWAQGEFQCLLFRAAGLTLALPLAKLSGVMPWDAAAVTALPNHQPWFLGLREHLDHQVKLIDVAKVILPPERVVGTATDNGAEAGTGPYGKVILIDDGRWGLVCTDVAEVITLSADAVKWRSRAGSRPWLAGTVIDRMCALIDTAAFASLLEGGSPQAA